jgi:hypothetical protein
MVKDRLDQMVAKNDATIQLPVRYSTAFNFWTKANDYGRLMVPVLECLAFRC